MIDLANLPKHVQTALELKRRGTVDGLPELHGWSPDFPLMPHQEVAAAWEYIVRKGINADQVGLGKMIEAFALVMLMRELGEPYRTLVICEPNTHQQWVDECARFTDLEACKIVGKPDERAYLYRQPWDIGVSTYPLLRRDYDQMRATKLEDGLDALVFDESSYFRHSGIKTHLDAYNLSKGMPRVLLLDGTPIQNSLLDIHAQMEVLHMNVFGSEVAFDLQHIVRESVAIKRGSRMINESKIVRYKNMDAFKRRLEPFHLRRTPDDVDAHMPEVVPLDVWLDLSPQQRKAYDAIRSNRIREYLAGRRQEFRNGAHLLLYACDTTEALGDDPGYSVKFDWIIKTIKGDLEGEQVVFFSLYKPVLYALRRRLEREGYQSGLFIGGDKDRDETKKAFLDGSLPYLLGTQAIEKGLNLQRSAYMIAIDQIPNPKRMEQLAGRLRRLASDHVHVYLVNMLTNDTVEGRRWATQKKRAALSDNVFDETSDIFEALTDEELFDYIRA